jgi:hypothetical protein
MQQRFGQLQFDEAMAASADSSEIHDPNMNVTMEYTPDVNILKGQGNGNLAAEANHSWVEGGLATAASDMEDMHQTGIEPLQTTDYNVAGWITPARKSGIKNFTQAVPRPLPKRREELLRPPGVDAKEQRHCITSTGAKPRPVPREKQKRLIHRLPGLQCYPNACKGQDTTPTEALRKASILSTSVFVGL